MNFFNFGPLEIVFILIIMIIVLGPKKMVETAQSLGKFMRKVVKSPLWHTVMDTSRELRDLPTRLVREAGLEEDISELKKTKDSLTKIGNISISDVPSPTKSKPQEKDETDKQILENVKEILGQGEKEPESESVKSSEEIGNQPDTKNNNEGKQD